MRVTIFAALVAFAAALGIQAAATPAAADGMADWKARTDAMKRMGGQARTFRNLDNTKDAAAAAKVILEVANTLPDHFQKDSRVAESRAKPEIWQNMGDVKSKIANLKAAAEKMLAAADSGDLAATKAAAGDVGGACGACHRAYRLPKKEM